MSVASSIAIPEVSLELIRRLDVPGPRYTSYPTVPVWSDKFDGSDYERALEQSAGSTQPLSLYVHVPFCREMCSYCGCNVVITRDQTRVANYLDAIGYEAHMIAARVGRRKVNRIHLGGGTPTFLDEEQLTQLLGHLESAFEIEPDAERALEINPAVTRASQLELLARHGFSRLSMGVQDFDPRVQAAVGRRQTVEETEDMLEVARSLGFKSVNFDFIYGLPGQTVESFTRTLEIAAGLKPDRLAVFAFAYVPKLKPHQRRLDQAMMPGPVARVALLRAAHATLGAAGYRAIGMDHFALPEDELSRAADEGRLGRDFQGYTVDVAPETVALGPTGISFVGGAYAQMEKPLGKYREAIVAGKFPVERGIWLTAEDRRRRDLITRLMCNFRLRLTDEEASHYAGELQKLKTLDPLVEVDGRDVVVTPLGRLFVRNVAMAFDAYLTPGSDRFSRTV